MERCTCGHLLRMQREQERKCCLECQIADALQIMLLPVPVPPMLEEACGYGSQAKYVAFYWGAGDEAYVDDGRSSCTGEWDAYLTLMQHPTVAPWLRGYDFGSSEEPAKQWLILDREHRQLLAAPVEVAQRLLQTQWGPVVKEVFREVSQQEWAQIVAQFDKQVKQIGMQQIFTLMQEHQRQVVELRTWLDHVGDSTPTFL